MAFARINLRRPMPTRADGSAVSPVFGASDSSRWSNTILKTTRE
jgi:hypothetical protein